MKRDVRLYLDEIIESCLLLEKYLKGVTENFFFSSQEKQDVTVRRLEIIGEAAAQIPEEFKKQHPTVPWGKMKGIRNIIIHEYFGINYERIWETATQLIPPLKKQIEDLLEEVEKQYEK